MKILKSSKFEPNHKKYLLLLEEDEDFKRFLTYHRQRLGLPTEGIILNGKNYKEVLGRDDAFWDKLVLSANTFILMYSLPNSWIDTAVFLIVFNIAVPPSKEFYKPIEIQEGKNGLIPEVRLIIREKISIKKLKDYLDKKGKEINIALSNLPKTPFSIQIKDIEIRKKILKMHKQGKKDSEIGEEIVKEYEDKTGRDLSFEADYRTIRKYRERFENKLKTLFGQKGLRVILTEFP